MVVLKAPEPAAKPAPSPEQLLYARVLDYGMKAGLAMLIAGFAAYVGGLVSAQVPLEELSRLWVLPVEDYLRESGMAAGWRWLALPDRGEVLALLGIVFLSGVSVPCLMALVPAYAARREWTYLVIAVLLIGVLVLAASGVLVAH
jgi:hypothetical protein